MQWCKYCKQYVKPIGPKSWSWFALIMATLFTGGLILFLYIPGRILTGIFTKGNCPICNADM